MSEKEEQHHQVHVYGNGKTLTSENQRLVDLVEKIKAEIERQRSGAAKSGSKTAISATSINSSSNRKSSASSHHNDDSDDEDDEDDDDSFDKLCITINSVSRGPGVVNIILGRGVRVYRH